MIVSKIFLLCVVSGAGVYAGAALAAGLHNAFAAWWRSRGGR